MNLSLDEISKAVEGALEGSGTVNVRGYSIDSRTIKPGELFFAIKGPRFDGHAFVAQVFQKGAAAAVVEQGGREAIRAALLDAKEGDTVVLAGKGHETYQIIGTTSHPFDDRVVARELLHELVVGRN